MTRQNQFVVIGAYGGHNAGDELLCLCATGLARELGDSTTIPIVVSGNAAIAPNTSKLYDELNLRVIRKKQIFSLIRELFYRNLIFGGGQILNESGISAGLIYLATATVLARCMGAKVFVVGVGGEIPGKSIWASFLLNLITKLSSVISIRDEYSLEALKKALRPRQKEKPSLGTDLAFFSRLPILDSATKHRSSALLCLQGDPLWGGNEIQKIIQQAAEFCNFAGERGLIPYLVMHDPRLTFDGGLGDKLSKELKARDINVASYRFNDLESLFRLYTSASVVASYRLHPLLISSIMEIPAVALSPSGKMASFAKRLGIPIAGEPQQIMESVHSQSLSDALQIATSKQVRSQIARAVKNERYRAEEAKSNIKSKL